MRKGNKAFPYAKIQFVFTWTPKVCEIMAFMAVIMGLGPFLYILLGFRQGSGTDSIINTQAVAFPLKHYSEAPMHVVDLVLLSGRCL